MVRKHGSLTHDEEINEAAWEAARGAVVGAAKVSNLHCLAWLSQMLTSVYISGASFQR